MNYSPLQILKAEAEMERRRRVEEAPPLWIPNPGPQTYAAESKANVLGYGGAAGGGKAIALNTQLPTPDGWVSMGDVAVDDWLFDETGLPCRVIATSEVMLDHLCYEVEFSDGPTIVADADHKWLTMTDKERISAHRRTPEFRAKRRATRKRRGTGKRPDLVKVNQGKKHDYLEPSHGSIRTTQEIYDTQLFQKRRVNHSIAVASSIQLPIADLPIDPYVLGIWLGDGSSYKGEVTTADVEVIDSIEVHYKTKHRKDYSYGIYKLLVPLRELGVLANKHIPQEYLRSSFKQRISLLQGLMDSDGYCDMRGHCEFTTTKIELASGCYELLGTLGIKSSISVGRAMLYGKDCGPKYRLRFMTDIPSFRLERKLSRQKRDGFRGTHSNRYIVNVRKVDSVPVKCVAVDSASYLYLAGESFIPTHNTDLL